MVVSAVSAVSKGGETGGEKMRVEHGRTSSKDQNVTRMFFFGEQTYVFLVSQIINVKQNIQFLYPKKEWVFKQWIAKPIRRK